MGRSIGKWGSGRILKQLCWQSWSVCQRLKTHVSLEPNTLYPVFSFSCGLCRAGTPSILLYHIATTNKE